MTGRAAGREGEGPGQQRMKGRGGEKLRSQQISSSSSAPSPFEQVEGVGVDARLTAFRPPASGDSNGDVNTRAESTEL